MHNVQYYLKNLDREKLETAFFETYPIRYEEWATGRETPDLPIGGIRGWKHEQFRNYIDRLCSMTPVETDSRGGKTGVIYTYRCLELGRLWDLETDLFFPEDGIDSYDLAYEFQSPEEILGYLVADNELTQLNIYDTIANVLFEASFFGYDDEERESKAGKILNTVKDAKKKIEEYHANPHRDHDAPPTVSLEDQLKVSNITEDDAFLNYLKMEAAESPKELTLRSHIEELMREYTSLSHQREREKVVKAWKRARG